MKDLTNGEAFGFLLFHLQRWAQLGLVNVCPSKLVTVGQIYFVKGLQPNDHHALFSSG